MASLSDWNLEAQNAENITLTVFGHLYFALFKNTHFHHLSAHIETQDESMD